MILDEILKLPLVETYELEDKPMNFDDLRELCDEFIEVDWVPGEEETLFPVGEPIPNFEDLVEGEPVYQQLCSDVVLLQEEPITFKVLGDGVTDYGVVQDAVLSIYRQKD